MCPHCKKTIGIVLIKPVEIQSLQATWQGVAYLCNQCNAVLSIARESSVTVPLSKT